MVADSKVLRFVCDRSYRNEIERQDGEGTVADSKVLRFVCGRSYRSEIGRQDGEGMVADSKAPAFRMRQIIQK